MYSSGHILWPRLYVCFFPYSDEAASVYQWCSFQESCVDINANLINRIDLYPRCHGPVGNSVKLLQVDNRQKHGAAWHVVNLYLSGTLHLFRPTHEQSLTNPFFSQWTVSNTSTADSSDSLWGSVGFPQTCLVQTENPTETNQKSVYDPLNTLLSSL